MALFFFESCSKLCVLAKTALFWQNVVKAACFRQNDFIFRKAAENCVFSAKSLYFCERCSKLYIFAQNDFNLANAAQNSGFGQNNLILGKAHQTCVY